MLIEIFSTFPWPLLLPTPFYHPEKNFSCPSRCFSVFFVAAGPLTRQHKDPGGSCRTLTL